MPRLSPACAFLLLGAALPAQIQPGEPAPELQDAVWVNEEPPAERLAELRGSVVVLWFFDTEDLGLSANLAIMRRAASRFVPRGLVLLALTDDGPAAATDWAEKHGLRIPVGAACGSWKDYNGGSSVTDLVFLLDHAGKVLWAGFGSDSTWMDLVPRAMTRAAQAWERFDPGAVPEALEEARNHCLHQRFAKAWRAAEKVQRKARAAGDQELEAAAGRFLEALEADAARRLEAARRQAERGCYHLALGLLERQVALYKGSDPGTSLEAQLKAWRRDRQVKRLRALDERRVEALDTIYEEGNRGKGLKILRELLEEARGTPLETTLKADLEAAEGR